MRYAITAVVSCGLFLGLATAPALAHQELPHLKPIPNPTCRTLQHTHGARHDRHLLWHLTRKGPAAGQYQRMYDTVSGESGWRSWARNPSGASGYAQFMPLWWAGRWHFDPFNGQLNIRVFIYCIEHPRETGGWSNWQGH